MWLSPLPRRALDLREIEQRNHLLEAIHLHGELRDFRAAPPQRLEPAGDIGRHALKVVLRQDDAPARVRPDEVRRERRGGFDVDVSRAVGQRALEDATALLLAPRETASFPLGAARHHDRRASPFERGGRIGPIGVVQSELDDVGAAGGVPAPADLLHRAARDDCAELRLRHRKIKKAPSARG